MRRLLVLILWTTSTQGLGQLAMAHFISAPQPATIQAKGARPSSSEILNTPSAASEALERCFDLEKSQRYAELYDLFSAKRKKYYRNFQVNDRKQYDALRRNSEASWRDFVLDRTHTKGANEVTFVGHADVEESGEKERVVFRTHFVVEDGRWKIDSWEY